MKDINISDGIFIPSPGSCPRGQTCGYRGGLGGQNFFFPKFNQIWRVSYLHQWHMQRHNFMGPHPLGPWGGAKRSNIIKSQSQSQFQRFLKQTLCVLSQMKDIKHIIWDFHSIASVIPQGWDLGVPWGVGGQKTFFAKFNQIWCASYLHEWHMQRHNILGPRLLEPWGGPKGQISLNLNYKVNFKDF